MSPTKKIVKVPRKRLTVVPLEKPQISDYEKDFYKWTQKQASILKRQDFSHLDLDNLIVEIESLGRSDKRALRSYLAVLLMHLLKSHYQAAKKTNSWLNSIRNARIQIRMLLEDSPSLKRELPKLIEDAYEIALIEASEETGLPENTFHKACPWKFEDLI